MSIKEVDRAVAFGGHEGTLPTSVALLLLASPAILGHVTLALGIVLLTGAVRDWLKVLKVHTDRPKDLRTSDAHTLCQITVLPSPAWLGLCRDHPRSMGPCRCVTVQGAMAAGLPYDAQKMRRALCTP